MLADGLATSKNYVLIGASLPPTYAVRWYVYRTGQCKPSLQNSAPLRDCVLSVVFDLVESISPEGLNTTVMSSSLARQFLNETVARNSKYNDARGVHDLSEYLGSEGRDEQAVKCPEPAHVFESL